MQDVPIRAMPAHQRFEVRDAGGITHASRSIRAIAVVQGFSPARISHLSIVVAECGADLLRNANGGELLVCPLTDSAGSHPGNGGGAGIEILSIGNRFHPSGQTPHLLFGGRLAFTSESGMTATRQYADEFDSWGLSAADTVLRVVMWSGNSDHDLAKASSGPNVGVVEYGAISVALRDQPVCGDAWTCVQGIDGFTVMLADGLGHGLLAHSAASPLPDHLPQTMVRPYPTLSAMHIMRCGPPLERRWGSPVCRRLTVCLRRVASAASTLAEPLPHTTGSPGSAALAMSQQACGSQGAIITSSRMQASLGAPSARHRNSTPHGIAMRYS
ncbi:hypothetical protein AWB76_02387 [Caballeronia temeraria]|uniref:Uncharacterized protein n=1 Tax=Caballeronia temeraria TaxID=1777137 RepID=A0A158AGR0_9BURK|nr:hypothetical protein [Caballeronia temeraria]SAK57002.1 hypothetical protein AWB76_02387 [Caballeronia temeraria]